MITIDIYGNFVDRNNPFIPVLLEMERDPRLYINIMGPVNNDLLYIQKKKYIKGDIAFGYGSPRDISGMHMGDYVAKLGYLSWDTNKVPYGSFYGLKKSLQKLDLLILPDTWQELLFEHVGTPMTVIPYPTTLNSNLQKDINTKRFTFLCIGRLTLKDNIGFIISAVMSLSKTYPNVKLILKTESGTLGHLRFPQENIEIIDGLITKEKYIELFNESDCFVYPTSSDSAPIHYFNAIEMGLPVIAPTHSGFSDTNVLTKHELIPAERFSRKYGDVGSYWSVDYEELRNAMEQAICGNVHFGDANEYHTTKGFVNDIIKLTKGLKNDNDNNRRN